MKRRKMRRIFLRGDCALCREVLGLLCIFWFSTIQHFCENIVKLYQKEQKKLDGQRSRGKVRSGREDSEVGGGGGREQERRHSRSWSRWPSCC